MAYFSIIVPAYNAQQTLARCLEPVCAQLLSCPSPGEVIVVDNNSTDQTAAIARSFSVRVLRCAERGRARARNAGIRAAQGEWIATVDADTVVDANWLSQLIEHANSLGLAAVQGPIELELAVNSAYAQHRFIAGKKTNDLLFAGGQSLPVIDTCAALFSRQALQSVGSFDESLSDYEDTDLTWKLLLAGFTLGFVKSGTTRKIVGCRFGPDICRMFERGAAHRALLCKWEQVFRHFGEEAPRHSQWMRRLAMRPRLECSAAAGLVAGIKLNVLRGAFIAGDQSCKFRRTKPDENKAMPNRGLFERKLKAQINGRSCCLSGEFAAFYERSRISFFNLLARRVISFADVQRDFADLLILQARSVNEAVQSIAQQYNAPAHEIRADIEQFLCLLADNGVIRVLKNSFSEP